MEDFLWTENELKYLNENGDELESLLNSKEYNKLWGKLASDIGIRPARKVFFGLIYVSQGEKGFKLEIITKGKSKSKARAEDGQIRFTLKFTAKEASDIELGGLKGTLRPERLTKDICIKPLRQTLFVYLIPNYSWAGIVNKVIGYVLDNANWPKP